MLSCSQLMIGLIELWTGWMTEWAINRMPGALPAQTSSCHLPDGPMP